MINGVTLTTMAYDPIGLALDPFLARFNHSCDYNATVRFGTGYNFHLIAIVPLRPIAKDEEITISYIDATMPFHRRQNELKQRYFFECCCPLCQDGILGEPDKLLSPRIDQLFENETILRVEQNAVDLLEAAGKDESISAPLQKLKYGMHLLAATGVWPLHRYPYATLRQQLVVAYLTAHQFHLAFIHAA